MPSLNWAQWVLLGLQGFSAVYVVATVGHEREPRTAGEAALNLVLSVAYAGLVVKAGGA